MNRHTPTLRLTALALAIGLFAPALGHAQVLADLVNDYATTGLPLTATGTGSWNLYASTTQDPTAGTLTALTFGSIGDVGNNGYGLSLDVPGVSAARIFNDGADPAGSFLAWHPGNSSPAYTVISWAAGTGESGPIRIEGTLSRMGEPMTGAVNFYVYVNGVMQFQHLYVFDDPLNDYLTFDLTAAITTGQTVSFVLDPNGGYAADESLISATISTAAIPEPSTYAALLGLGALGLVIVRRRRAA